MSKRSKAGKLAKPRHHKAATRRRAIGDIDRRQQMEQALLDSERRYALAMQAVNEGVYDWNIATDGIYYSPSVHNALGLKPEELRSRTDWLDRIHPDDLMGFKQAVTAHLKGETERLTCEYRYRHPDGSWHWARQHGLALRDQSGRAYRMAGSTGDITLEKDLAQQKDTIFQELSAVLAPWRSRRPCFLPLIGRDGARTLNPQLHRRMQKLARPVLTS
jgi:PAS domain S-box-containing protein